MRNIILLAAMLIFIAPVITGAQERFIDFDKMPEALEMNQPVYPEDAKKEKVTCEVLVKIFIDENGDVTDAKTGECTTPGMGFEEAALDAAYQNKFKPAEKDGQPVGVWMSYKVKFKLDDKKQGKK